MLIKEKYQNALGRTGMTLWLLSLGLEELSAHPNKEKAEVLRQAAVMLRESIRFQAQANAEEKNDLQSIVDGLMALSLD